MAGQEGAEFTTPVEVSRGLALGDLDNDGDQDVILGRSLLKTSYLENRQGIFYQHPIPKFMPMAVLSMSADACSEVNV